MNPDCPPEIHPFTSCWHSYNQCVLTPESAAAWVIDREKGYFGFLPNRQIKHLIIGSFPIWASVHHNPPHPGFDFSFFYCSRANGFFRILETINGYTFFPNPKQMTPHQKAQSVTNFFLQNQLGITDVLEQIRRTDLHCCNSDDKSLEAKKFNSIMGLLSDYQSIVDIYFTSGNVYKWFNDYLKQATRSTQIRKNFFVKNLRRHIGIHNIISPSNMANTAIAGNLNKDEKLYGLTGSMRENMIKIPIVMRLEDEKDQYRVCQWAKHLSNVPGLVRSEILLHANYRAIESRL